jgi:hypothetical protein
MRTLLIVMLTLSPMAASAKTNCRDAKTGNFVTAAYAKKHPTTTVCEKVK